MGKDEAPHPQTHGLQTSELGEVRTLIFEFPDEPPVSAIVIGDVESTRAPLVRIHSRCLYGEVFGSSDCDCREQLGLAFRLLREEGAGVFIYLEQEGRGCGLLRKAQAYALRDSVGLDTFDAYRRIGLAVDPRLYKSAAAVLKHLGLAHVRLLTNNPSKVSGLIEAGIRVEQVNLRTEATQRNVDYLRAKQFKLGHDLGLFGDDRDLGG